MIAYFRRSLLVHVRERSAVAFSLMAPAILLVLYAGFLGQMQVDGIVQAMPAVSLEAARGATAAWVASSMLMVTTMTSSLVAVTQLVQDRTEHQIDDFLVSPLRGRAIIGGAWLASFVYAMGVVVPLGVVCLVGMALLGATLPSAGGLATLFAALAVSTAAFAALNILLATVLPSQSAVGGVIGTYSSVVGFLAGVYVPVGILSEGIATAVFSLPFGQSGYLVRDALASPALEALAGSPESLAEVRKIYGFDFAIGGAVRPTWIAWAGVTALAVICLTWAMTRVRSLSHRK